MAAARCSPSSSSAVTEFIGTKVVTATNPIGSHFMCIISCSRFQSVYSPSKWGPQCSKVTSRSRSLWMWRIQHSTQTLHGYYRVTHPPSTAACLYFDRHMKTVWLPLLRINCLQQYLLFPVSTSVGFARRINSSLHVDFRAWSREDAEQMDWQGYKEISWATLLTNLVQQGILRNMKEW